MPADQRESVVPAHRHIMIGRGVVAHRLGQPALHFEPVIGLRHQVGDAMLGKKFARDAELRRLVRERSEEHTSELQSLMRISYAVFCLKKKKHTAEYPNTSTTTKPRYITRNKYE